MKALIAKFSNDIWLDGFLYACIAMFMFSQGFFSSDEAYKYVSPFTLFWIKYIFGVLGAGAGSVKMFRSTVFADSKTEPDKSTMVVQQTTVTKETNEKTTPSTSAVPGT